MKYILLALALAFGACSFGQQTGQSLSVGDTVYPSAEQMPEYPGGPEAMMKFIQKNIVYPDMKHSADGPGKVVVRFIVNEDGSLSDVKAIRGFNLAMNAEAERVVKMMPKFKPGMQGGKAVKVIFNLPIPINPPEK